MMAGLNETFQSFSRELGGIEEHLKAQDEKFKDCDKQLAKIDAAVSGKNGLECRVTVIETERDTQGRGWDRRITITAICVAAIAAVAGVVPHFL